MVTSIHNNLGVGSGLPLEATLKKLREVENVALSLVQSRYDRTNQRLSAYGQLKSSLESFQKTAAALRKPETLGSMKGSSSMEGINVTPSDKAIAGTYQVDVKQLARAQTVVAAGCADRNAQIGTGGKVTLTFQDGTTKTLDLSEKGTTLDDLIKAINADANLGLDATIVQDGSDAPHRLVLTTKATGSQAALSGLSVQGNDALQGLLGFEHLTEQQAAQDAQLSINGIPVRSATNNIQDAIAGISLNLSSTGSGTVTIARNNEAARKAIDAFVDAYNALQNTLKKLTAYDSGEQRSSVLTGDSLARRVQNQIRETLNVANGNPLGSLSRLGIATDPSTGQLQTDQAKLDAALKAHLPDVLALFADENGIAARVTDTADAFLRSDGVFSTSDASIQQTLKSLKNEYANTERRIDAKIAAYRAQFVALDRKVAEMSSVSSYLNTQLGMLKQLGANA